MLHGIGICRVTWPEVGLGKKGRHFLGLGTGKSFSRYGFFYLFLFSILHSTFLLGHAKFKDKRRSGPHQSHAIWFTFLLLVLARSKTKCCSIHQTAILERILTNNVLSFTPTSIERESDDPFLFRDLALRFNYFFEIILILNYFFSIFKSFWCLIFKINFFKNIILLNFQAWNNLKYNQPAWKFTVAVCGSSTFSIHANRFREYLAVWLRLLFK